MKKDLIPKYKLNDRAVIINDTWLVLLGVDVKKSFLINQIFIETDPKFDDYEIHQKIRYKLDSLWFDENEIKVITRKKNPEYWL